MRRYARREARKVVLIQLYRKNEVYEYTIANFDNDAFASRRHPQIFRLESQDIIVHRNGIQPEQRPVDQKVEIHADIANFHDQCNIDNGCSFRDKLHSVRFERASRRTLGHSDMQ